MAHGPPRGTLWKIALIVEGRTEKVFRPNLKSFVDARLGGREKPKIATHSYDGRIPTGPKLKRVVDNLLRSADHVIALTDVYTGSRPPEFKDAADARAKMRSWVGPEPRFHPHAAQYDFEAWLLPYWGTIVELAKSSQKSAPFTDPERVNHNRPPAHLLREIFEAGGCRDSYSKPRDAARILRDNDLTIAISRCQELRALVNTILGICGGDPV